ncbi:MAG: RhuM family protein [Candidatus Komeilibacteria bacterium]
MKELKQLVIYQAKNGSIEFRGDFKRDTIWGMQKQIADIFDTERSVVTKHINKILKDGEVDEKSNVQKMHIANSDKPVKFYSLDIILAVGYRTNSAKAIVFRKWATEVLKQHLIDGYTVNKGRIKNNYKAFQKALYDLKAVIPASSEISTKDALELINLFSSTWMSLEAYDKENFPKNGSIRKKVDITAKSLVEALNELKANLIAKKQATDIFGKERAVNSVEGIIGNVFQSFGNKDVYPSNEEKAANFLYYIVKNHPFIDGNKRSAAFTFVWYLNKAGLLKNNLSPEALTTLTLLIAESKSGDKDKMIGLVLLLLGIKIR